jgi:hypothetical protein
MSGMTRIEVPNTAPRRKGSAFKRALLTLLVIAVVAPVLWTFFSLWWSYSDGERAGILQKFSRRGWVCKTAEGELALYVVSGISPQIWDFSVRDEATVEALNKAVGRKVQLHYTEHRALPTSCFGETSYFVDRVTLVEDGSVPGP